jgi:hypothetical protein
MAGGVDHYQASRMSRQICDVDVFEIAGRPTSSRGGLWQCDRAERLYLLALVRRNIYGEV